MFKNFTLLFLLLLCFDGLYSQINNTQAPINDSLNLRKDSVEIDPVYRRFKTSVTYSSANTMLGKRDSLPIPVLSPTFKYTTSKDFIYQIAVVHSNTTNKMFDELDLKVGKNFYVGSRWNFTLSYTKYIFSKDVNAYAGFDWGHDVYTGLSLDYTSGKKTIPFHSVDSIFNKKTNKYNLVNSSGYSYVQGKDFTATLTNSISFYFYEIFNENDKIILSPEIDVMWGTQNGVQTNATTKKLAKGNGKNAKSSSQTIKTNIPFMAYIFNLDFTYKVNRWGFNISPYYTIPQNISSGADSSPYFVMYGGINYTLKWEHPKNI